VAALRGPTHPKSRSAHRLIGNNPGRSAPFARLKEISVLPAGAPVPQRRPSALANPQAVDSPQGGRTRAQRVRRGSAPDGRRGRKTIAVAARQRHLLRLGTAENAVRGIAAGRPPRGRLRAGRDRLTGPGRGPAAPAEGAHLAPSQSGTREKAATARDSIKADQAPERAIGLDLRRPDLKSPDLKRPDLKRPDRRRQGPVNSSQRIRGATDRDLSGPAAHGRLQGSAAPDHVLPLQPVLPAAKAWPVRSQPAPANRAQAGRGQAVSQERPPGVRSPHRDQERRARPVLGQRGNPAGSPSPATAARAGRRPGAASDRRRRTLRAAPGDGRGHAPAQSDLVAGRGTKHPPVEHRVFCASLYSNDAFRKLYPCNCTLKTLPKS
jgi:hypothetical protein